MATIKNITDQTIIPICKGALFGLCLTLSIMLGVEQMHLNMEQRLEIAVVDVVLTTEDSRYE